MHPADWKKVPQGQRMSYILDGEFEGRDWRIDRVAHLVGVDPERLDWIVEAEHGWEPHDIGYLHKVVDVAGQMVAGTLT